MNPNKVGEGISHIPNNRRSRSEADSKGDAEPINNRPKSRVIYDRESENIEVSPQNQITHRSSENRYAEGSASTVVQEEIKVFYQNQDRFTAEERSQLREEGTLVKIERKDRESEEIKVENWIIGSINNVNGILRAKLLHPTENLIKNISIDTLRYWDREHSGEAYSPERWKNLQREYSQIERMIEGMNRIIDVNPVYPLNFGPPKLLLENLKNS